jgi:hypothetical protein
MSVLIKGMEMPRNCDDCRLGIDCAYDESQDGYKMMGGRPHDCPLVHVPPHGRLGDLDKLENGMRHMAKYQYGERQQGILGCCETIRLAPTIIPAYPPKEESNG